MDDLIEVLLGRVNKKDGNDGLFDGLGGLVGRFSRLLMGCGCLLVLAIAAGIAALLGGVVSVGGDPVTVVVVVVTIIVAVISLIRSSMY